MAQNPHFQALAAKHGFSENAVEHMYYAIQSGNGTMAQFSHPEFGGSGQWMSGGMIMIGDMFNNGLKARVNSLCYDLLSVPAPPPPQTFAQPSYGYQQSSWWPQQYGSPASSGGQNDFQYAYFPGNNRLAIRYQNVVHIYDTIGHSIGGFSQQQGNGLQSFFFTSQRGMFPVTSLLEVFGAG
jgi:hypothetical protein